jgi:hypothetical protein
MALCGVRRTLPPIAPRPRDAMRPGEASVAVTVEDDDARESDQLGGKVGFLATPQPNALQEISAPSPTDAGANSLTCEHCGTLFRPRRSSGGSLQKFCSTTCRYAAHAPRVPSVDVVPSVDNARPSVDPSVASVAPAYTLETPPAAVPQPADETPTGERLNPDPTPSEETDFDWHEDPSVVVPHQSAIAVYRNKFGAVVIRQEGADYEDDVWVIVNREYLASLIDALRRLEAEG